MLPSVALVLLSASSVFAVSCSLDSKCPKESPCCSQYGECGVGAYCLGGCDPRMSFSLDSCMPAPVCKDKTMKFTDTSSIVDISKYLGDSSKADWVSQGEPVAFDGNVLLTMPQESVGTVLTSTEYMWYGKVKATLKTSRGRGVITAFILYSDVKDEIDFEFVGVDLQTAQTNYYFQGITDYHNSGNISGLSDTFSDFHEYEVQWTPESITWLVDGRPGRTLLRKDTYNASSHQFQYPQTPARVELSIWPGGLASNAQGTIDWAGGLIDWNSDDIKKAGYYYATFQEVSIECYKTSTPPGTNSGKSYTYNSVVATNDTIVDGDKDTILASFDATGLDPEAGKQDSSPSSGGASKTASGTGPKNTQAQIPGGGNGSSGNDHSDAPGNGNSSSPGDSAPGNGDASGGSGSGVDSSNCDTSSFNQNCGASADNSKGVNHSSGSRKSASALAIFIAGTALYLL